MAIDADVCAAMYDQITLELYSERVYLALGAWAENAGWLGSARWLSAHGLEERGHAMKFVAYLTDNQMPIIWQPIPAPPNTCADLVAAFEAALQHEEQVTASIKRLFGIARRTGDFQAEAMLHWFLTEQVEEEKKVGDVLAQLRLADGNKAALLELDGELGD